MVRNVSHEYRPLRELPIPISDRARTTGSVLVVALPARSQHRLVIVHRRLKGLCVINFKLQLQRCQRRSCILSQLSL